MSEYIIVRKFPLYITDYLTIPLPYSHVIDGKSKALEWMIKRGLQRECKVISNALFMALSGIPYIPT